MNKVIILGLIAALTVAGCTSNVTVLNTTSDSQRGVSPQTAVASGGNDSSNMTSGGGDGASPNQTTGGGGHGSNVSSVSSSGGGGGSSSNVTSVGGSSSGGSTATGGNAGSLQGVGSQCGSASECYSGYCCSGTCSSTICAQACTPSCSGKTCGGNGCDGSCGSCSDGYICNSNGQCIQSCAPSCSGKTCGSDGCGSSCGSCPTGMDCVNNICSCIPSVTCSSAGKICGPLSDGCGKALNCGSCSSNQACMSGNCVDISSHSTTQEIGALFFKDVYSGSWDELFDYMVDSSGNSLSADCQTKMKNGYAPLLGYLYSLSISDSTTPCSSLTHSSMPAPSFDCVSSDYKINTTSASLIGFSTTSSNMFFVNVSGQWKIQTNCGWYS